MHRTAPIRRLLNIPAFMVTLVLAGCETEPLPEAPPPPNLQQTAATQAPASVLQTFAYNCLINGYVVTDFRQSEDSMWLFLPTTTVLLKKEPSASGTRYTNGDIRFWSKGNEALLEDAEGKDHCVEDRQASILEDAKLRGVDFRGTGNEPGWVLEISGNKVLLTTNYGQDVYRYTVSGHDYDAGTRTATYSNNADNPAIHARIVGKTCADDMSGKRFETTVEIELNGATYQGCGQGLH